MDRDRLPPRSTDSLNEVRKEKLKPVVKKKVTVKKPSPLRLFLSRFFEGSVDDMKSFLIWDLIVPETKTIFQDFIDTLFWRDGKKSSRSRRSSGSSGNVPYSSISTQKAKGERKRRTSGFDDAYVMFGLEEIITDTKQEALEVLETMDQLIGMYGKVSVADLFELINESCEYNATYFGWTSLDGAYVSRTNGGWLINLPRCERLR